MRLLSMKLEDFKGVRSFTLEPQGQDLSVYGANATGKTTLADAFWWLLFGKNSAGASDFNVLPLDANGKRVEGVTEASVEATLAYDGNGIHDGKQVTLRRVFAERWVKKRGRSDREFDGHETAYWIDGVPKKAGEYAAFIKGIVDEEQFKLVSNPRYFNELLDWKSRRKVVMGLDGNITDADVFGSDPELFGLSEQLKGRSVEDYRRVVEAELKKTNQELDKLPVRIDEAGKSIPEAMPLPGDLTALRKDRSDKTALLAQTDTGGMISERVKALREIEGQIVDLDNKHREKQGHEVSAARAMVDEAKSEVKGIERDLEAMGKTATDYLNDIKANEGKVNELAVAWEAAQDKTFQHEDVTTCYACGQSLPEAAVKAAHDRGLAVFNAAKSSEIEQIETAGKAKQETLKALREKLAKVQQGIEDGFKLLEKAKQNVTVAENKLTSITSSTAATVSPDPRRHQLADQQLGLQAEIEDLKRGAVDPAKDKLAAEIANLDSLIAETEKASANNERRQTGLKRIEELKAQQKDLGKTYEKLEHQRDLCERFIVAKAELLTATINGNFKLARFRLFEKQINGGISDTCEVMVNGVPYSDLNGAAKINVGLDVIDALSQVYDFTAPIMVDNCESVCELLPTRGQQIRLYVSSEYQKMRVEAK